MEIKLKMVCEGTGIKEDVTTISLEMYKEMFIKSRQECSKLLEVNISQKKKFFSSSSS